MWLFSLKNLKHQEKKAFSALLHPTLDPFFLIAHCNGCCLSASHSTFTSFSLHLSTLLHFRPASDMSPQSSNDAKQDNSTKRTSIAAGTPTLSKTETVFCGATAGVVSRFVIAPLDVVKIRLQVPLHWIRLFLQTNHPSTVVAHTSVSRGHTDQANLLS